MVDRGMPKLNISGSGNFTKAWKNRQRSSRNTLNSRQRLARWCLPTNYSLTGRHLYMSDWYRLASSLTATTSAFKKETRPAFVPNKFNVIVNRVAFTNTSFHYTAFKKRIFEVVVVKFIGYRRRRRQHSFKHNRVRAIYTNCGCCPWESRYPLSDTLTRLYKA